VVKDSKSPYHQVHKYVDHFKDWHSGVKIVPSPLDAYERNLSIKMSMKDWIKLSHDLNYSEMDEKSKPLLQDYLKYVANALITGIQGIHTIRQLQL
jgi:hypothetical protein